MNSTTSDGRFRMWRHVHLVATGLLGAIAFIHCCATALLYHSWSEDAVWFLGAGLGLLLLSALNWTHIGSEPCRRPTVRLIKAANCVFLVFGVGAVIAVPTPQAYLILGCLAVQAVAAIRTLPGPNR